MSYSQQTMHPPTAEASQWQRAHTSPPLLPLSTTAPLWASYIMKIRKHKTTQFPNPQLSINAGNISLGFLPEMRDTIFNTWYSNKLRSLATSDYPCKVPKKVDKQVFLTISLNLQDCPPNQTCKGYLGKRFSASINNQSLVRPTISNLESHYHNKMTIYSQTSLKSCHIDSTTQEQVFRVIT